MARIFAIADVGDYQQIRQFPLDGADRPLHDAVVVIGAGRFFILRFRHAKQDDATDPEVADFAALLHGRYRPKAGTAAASTGSACEPLRRGK